MHLGTFLVSHSNKDLPSARIYWLRRVALLHFLALPARDTACLIALFRVAWRHVVCARRHDLGVVQVCAFLLLVLLLCGADGAINARQQPNSDVPPLVLHLELDFSGCSIAFLAYGVAQRRVTISVTTLCGSSFASPHFP